MDKEEFEKIKRLSDNATAEIMRLQAEILRYKNGADSFSEATVAIKELSGKQDEILKTIDEYVKALEKLDFKGKIEAEYKRMKEMTERLEKTAGKLEKAQRELSETERRVEDGQDEFLEEVKEENRAMRREMRKMREEILEKMSEKSRKGFRLFGKK